MIKYQEQSHELHESFHSQLEKADDGFSVVADYFGRGVFNTLTIVPPEGTPNLPPSTRNKTGGFFVIFLSLKFLTENSCD